MAGEVLAASAASADDLGLPLAQPSQPVPNLADEEALLYYFPQRALLTNQQAEEFTCESSTAIARKLTAKLKLSNAFIKRAFGTNIVFPIDVEVRVALGTILQDTSYRAKIFEWRDGHQINGAPRQRYWLTHLQEIKRYYNNPDVLAYRLVSPTIMVLRLHSEPRAEGDVSPGTSAAAYKRLLEGGDGSPPAKKGRFNNAVVRGGQYGALAGLPADVMAAAFGNVRSMGRGRNQLPGGNEVAAMMAAALAPAAIMAAQQAAYQMANGLHPEPARPPIEEWQLKMLHDLSSAAAAAGLPFAPTWAAGVRHGPTGEPVAIVLLSPEGFEFGSVPEALAHIRRRAAPAQPSSSAAAAAAQRLRSQMEDGAICEAGKYLLLGHLAQTAAAAGIELQPGWRAELRFCGNELETEIISPDGFMFPTIDAAIEHLTVARHINDLSRLDILAAAAAQADQKAPW